MMATTTRRSMGMMLAQRRGGGGAGGGVGREYFPLCSVSPPKGATLFFSCPRSEFGPSVGLFSEPNFRS